MIKIIQLFFISLVLISCSKESACELENIGYVDINNADNEPYTMYIDGVLTQTVSSEYYLSDYEI
ncbi:MAG: hypothetical protein VX762_04360 [Bacteroidota bacterium]|nr:hypothetical protein [Bacteroidota bacterium]